MARQLAGRLGVTNLFTTTRTCSLRKCWPPWWASAGSPAIGGIDFWSSPVGSSVTRTSGTAVLALRSGISAGPRRVHLLVPHRTANLEALKRVDR